MRVLFAGLIVSLCPFAWAQSSAPDALTPITPFAEGFGVNVNFTRPVDGELDMLVAGGFSFVRRHLDWASTEKQRGHYDFAEHYALMNAASREGVRAIFTLGSANPLYDANCSPATDEGRRAFANWAAAAVERFRGRGVIWEIYNEPNISPFWRPKPNADDYVKLALEAANAIKRSAPQEQLVGPACAGFDWPFLEACFKGGLLEHWSAVTVHPKNARLPEAIESDYRQLRLLIARYAPAGKTIPIYCGEWGCSSSAAGEDDESQAKLLARQWLTNIANDVPVSIWSDWSDGADHHFGVVEGQHYARRTPLYDAKPAFVVAKALTRELNGFEFNKLLYIERDDDYVLLFTRGDELKIVAWSSAREPHTSIIPAITGEFAITRYTGEEMPGVRADERGLPIVFSGGVQYLAPRQPIKKADALYKLAKWKRAPLEQVITAPAEVARRTVMQGQRPVMIHELSSVSRLVHQRTLVVVRNPMSLSLARCAQRGLVVTIDNPSGEPFFGTARLIDARSVSMPVNIATGQTRTTVALPLTFRTGDPTAAVEVMDGDNRVVVASPVHRFVALPLAAENLIACGEGDPRVGLTHTLSAGGERKNELGINYAFDAGRKTICIKPASPLRVDGEPRALGLWIRGDASANVPRLRFTDSTGQAFQCDAPPLAYRDWQYARFDLTSPASQGGGASDGVVHWPIQIEALLAIENATRMKSSGEIAISQPTLVYEEASGKAVAHWIVPPPIAPAPQPTIDSDAQPSPTARRT